MFLRVNNVCMEWKIFAVVHYIFRAVCIHPSRDRESIYHLAMVIFAMIHCIFSLSSTMGIFATIRHVFSISSYDGQYLQQFLASLVYLLTMLRSATRIPASSMCFCHVASLVFYLFYISCSKVWFMFGIWIYGIHIRKNQ